MSNKGKGYENEKCKEVGLSVLLYGKDNVDKSKKDFFIHFLEKISEYFFKECSFF